MAIGDLNFAFYLWIIGGQFDVDKLIEDAFNTAKISSVTAQQALAEMLEDILQVPEGTIVKSLTPDDFEPVEFEPVDDNDDYLEAVFDDCEGCEDEDDMLEIFYAVKEYIRFEVAADAIFDYKGIEIC